MKRVLKFVSIYVVELVIFFLAIGIYNHLFKLERGDMSLGIVYNYYTLIIYPVILFICNLVTVIVKNNIVNIFVYIFSAITILAYWLDVFSNYPFRTLFVLFISIIILLIGMFISVKLLRKR